MSWRADPERGASALRSMEGAARANRAGGGASRLGLIFCLVRFIRLQKSRCSGRSRLELRDPGIVFGRKLQQPFLGGRVGVLGETAAAIRLFFQGCEIHSLTDHRGALQIS
jgi:hypothetical protein